MSETITMSGKEQRRAWILTKLLVGELSVAAAFGTPFRPSDVDRLGSDPRPTA